MATCDSVASQLARTSCLAPSSVASHHLSMVCRLPPLSLLVTSPPSQLSGPGKGGDLEMPTFDTCAGPVKALPVSRGTPFPRQTHLGGRGAGDESPVQPRRVDCVLHPEGLLCSSAEASGSKVLPGHRWAQESCTEPGSGRAEEESGTPRGGGGCCRAGAKPALGG